jgi:uncharacterized protein
LIYLDSCALLKLVLPEAETPELRAFLSARAMEGHATSALSQTEIARALIRVQAEPEVADAAEDMFGRSRLVRIRVTDPLLRAAGMFPMRHLRSLDAIHLASAEDLEDALTAFITYDKRLAAAARERDLPVQTPGGPL